MQADPSLIDGIIEIADAVINPAVVGLPSFESLGLIAVFGLGAIFIGVSRTVAPQFGTGAATAVGVMLTIALLAYPPGLEMVGSAFVALATMLKLVSGLALGRLMGRNLAFAVVGLAAMIATAFVLTAMLPSMGVEVLSWLKLFIVIAAGTAAYDLLMATEAGWRFGS
ncbi:MAG: hypothetical protein KJZ47_09540, partial [Gemmatimonadales bacterium]|nr:hypothetical protein [Gemmatimonadales bacterium]